MLKLYTPKYEKEEAIQREHYGGMYLTLIKMVYSELNKSSYHENSPFSIFLK